MKRSQMYCKYNSVDLTVKIFGPKLLASILNVEI